MALRLFLTSYCTSSKRLEQESYFVPLKWVDKGIGTKAKKVRSAYPWLSYFSGLSMVQQIAFLSNRIGLFLLLISLWPMTVSASAPSLPVASFSVSTVDWYCGSSSASYPSFASARAALFAYTNGCSVAGPVTADTCSGIEPSVVGTSGSCSYVRFKPSQGDSEGGSVSWSFSCPQSMKYNPASGFCEASDSWQAGKNNFTGCNMNDVGNPCNAGTGHKHQLESDYQAAGLGGLRFLRRYSSLQVGSSQLGAGWRHNFDGRILKDPAGKFVRVERPNGQTLIFRPNGAGGWLSDSDINDQLQEGAQWRYTTADKEVEVYAASGRLQSISDRNGVTQTLSYSDANTAKTIAPQPGLLIQVGDQFGRKIQLNYDKNARIVTLIDSSGVETRYLYDAVGRLASVIYPDDTPLDMTDNPQKQYYYEDNRFPNALTGIDAVKGIRFASWSYDAQGRAISSRHAGDVEKVTLDYNADGSTKVNEYQNNPNIASVSRLYGFQSILGVVKNTGISQPNPGGGTSSSVSTYDTNGNLASRTDFNGNLSCYAYDLTRNLETVRVEGLPAGSSCPANLAAYTPPTGSNQHKISSQWHATYRLPIQIDQAGQRLNFSYDTSGNLLQKTVTDTATQQSRSWTYTYNAIGQVLSEDGPRTDVNDTTTYSYYGDSTASHKPGDLQSVANALGHTTTFTAYDANGRLLSLTDPNGLIIGFAYDARGRLTQKTVDGNATQYQYDPAGNLVKVTRPSGVFFTYSYDAAHRLTDITDGLGGKIHYMLDAMGNRIQEDILAADGTVVKTHSQVYDALSRLQKDIGAYNQTSQYQYDANGNLTQITDANGNASLRQYDSLDRLIRTTDALNGQTDYFYDPQDRLTQLTDPNSLSTVYSYSGLGDLTQQNSPDTGLTQNSQDSAGNLSTATDANGIQASYSYDGLNRLTQIGYDKPGTVTEKIVFQYDQSLNGYVGANGIGRLTALGGNTSSLTYLSYDVRGRITLRQQSTGSLHLNLQIQYDNEGRIKTLTYPSGHVVDYLYDASGRVNQINIDGVPAVTGITWQAFGGMQGWTWAGSGNRYNRDYDLSGRISAVTLGKNRRHLVWDAGDRLSQSSDEAIASPGTPTNPQSFGYDELGGLNQYQSSAAYQNYSYDADGNRINQTFDSGITHIGNSYEVGSNRLTASGMQHYQYDAVGRVASDGINQYRYNNAGRLAEVVNSQGRTWYYYNGLGQRVGKWRSRPSDLAGDADHDGRMTLGDYRRIAVIANGSYVLDLAADCNRDNAVTLADTVCVKDKYGQVATDTQAFTHYVYDPAGHLIGEYLQLGTPIQETVYLGDTPVLIMMPDANATALYTIDTDHLDTPRVIKNSAGAIVWRWDQAEPFGITLPDGNPSGLGAFTYNLRFPGQYYDQETGLHYNMERYYHPGLGRYLQSDPIGLVGGVNTYTYVGNNPVNYTDPYGLTPQGAAYGAALFGGSAAVLSVAADVGSWGVNIPATPAEIALATATGAYVGNTISDFFNNVANNIYNAKPPENAYDPNGPKAPGKPGEAEGFRDPKGGENWVPNPNPRSGGSSHGWEDDKGRVWCPTGQGGRAHGGPHWDVQKPGGGYDNVLPVKP